MTDYANQNSQKATVADSPLSEIRMLMNDQQNALTAIDETLSLLFTKVAPILAAPLPENNIKESKPLNSDLGSEINTNNLKLWAVNTALYSIIERAQL